MPYPKVKIEPENLSKRAEISLENCTGFTVENQGNTIIYIGFKGAATGKALSVQPGSDRLFNGSPGAVFSGELIIEFDDSEVPEGVIPQNSALVIKQIFLGC